MSAVPGPQPLAAPDRSAVEALVALGADLGAPLPSISVAGRIERVQALIVEAGNVDALIVSALINVRWCTGFTGTAGLLVVPASGRATFITDARYAERSADELAAVGCDARIEVRAAVEDQQALVVQLLADAERIGLEAAHVSWSAVRAHEEQLAGHQLVPTVDVVEGLRRRKDAAEIARLARASAIADQALAATMELMRSGLSEAQFARALDTAMVTLGADGVSFDTIIASGPNGSRPHHSPGPRVIEEGDLVICDFGALVDGYHSDMTRTVCVGRPSSAQVHHLDVVRAAQQAGVDAAQDGTPTRSVDAACRSVIESHGWGEHYTHGTGHGIGLVIHEAPWVGRTSAATLEPGDSVTVEPGVYLPGVAGVRIEDSLVITEQGPVRLTNAPKHLVV